MISLVNLRRAKILPHVVIAQHVVFDAIILYINIIFNQVFNENRVIVMLKSAAGGHAGGRQLLVSAQ